MLITGAGRGLGHGVARGLASHGATILAVSRTQSELDELEKTVKDAGGQIETYSIDLGQATEVDSLTQEITNNHGTPDGVINNAAILRMTPFLELTPTRFSETLEINLIAPVRIIDAFLPGMIDRGSGAIVNVSSAAGVRGFVNETDYCASKYGLEGFSYSLAMELKTHNISVNLMTPGYHIKPTSVTAAEFEGWSAERKAAYRDPIDMADGFAFLMLQDGSGVTGKRFNAFELAERVRNVGWEWNMKAEDREK